MPYTNEGLDPETISILDDCLDAAFAIATSHGVVRPMTRTTLATAVFQGWDHGFHDPEQLVQFALQAIPRFRTAGARPPDADGMPNPAWASV